MSETPSEDEGFETADVEQVSETSTGDDAARDNLPLQLCARLDALEACTVELLRRFDESKCNMDRYYHAFLELETVPSRTSLSERGVCVYYRAVWLLRLLWERLAVLVWLLLMSRRWRLLLERLAVLLLVVSRTFLLLARTTTVEVGTQTVGTQNDTWDPDDTLELPFEFPGGGWTLSEVEQLLNKVFPHSGFFFGSK